MNNQGMQGNMGMNNQNMMGSMNMNQMGMQGNMGMNSMGMQQNNMGMMNQSGGNMGMNNMGMNNMGMMNQSGGQMGMNNMGMNQMGMQGGMNNMGMMNQSGGQMGMNNMGMQQNNMNMVPQPNGMQQQQMGMQGGMMNQSGGQMMQQPPPPANNAPPPKVEDKTAGVQGLETDYKDINLEDLKKMKFKMIKRDLKDKPIKIDEERDFDPMMWGGLTLCNIDNVKSEGETDPRKIITPDVIAGGIGNYTIKFVDEQQTDAAKSIKTHGLTIRNGIMTRHKFNDVEKIMMGGIASIRIKPPNCFPACCCFKCGC